MAGAGFLRSSRGAQILSIYPAALDTVIVYRYNVERKSKKLRQFLSETSKIRQKGDRI